MGRGRALRAMLSFSICTLVGCTTMQQVERDAVPRALAELAPGDRISVRTAQMWDDVTVVAVDAATLRIERRSGEQVTLARDDLPDIRVKRRAPGPDDRSRGRHILRLGRRALRQSLRERRLLTGLQIAHRS